jgi:hypothetical protein
VAATPSGHDESIDLDKETEQHVLKLRKQWRELSPEEKQKITESTRIASIQFFDSFTDEMICLVTREPSLSQKLRLLNPHIEALTERLQVQYGNAAPYIAKFLKYSLIYGLSTNIPQHPPFQDCGYNVILHCTRRLESLRQAEQNAAAERKWRADLLKMQEREATLPPIPSELLHNAALTARQKAEILRRFLERLNKVGVFGRDGEVRLGEIRARGGSIRAARRFFEANPQLCASDIGYIFINVLEFSDTKKPDDGGYDERFYLNRGHDLGFVLTHIRKFNDQMLLELPITRVLTKAELFGKEVHREILTTKQENK